MSAIKMIDGSARFANARRVRNSSGLVKNGCVQDAEDKNAVWDFLVYDAVPMFCAFPAIPTQRFAYSFVATNE
jgi:hypothetical protein